MKRIGHAVLTKSVVLTLEDLGEIDGRLISKIELYLILGGQQVLIEKIVGTSIGLNSAIRMLSDNDAIASLSIDPTKIDFE